MSATSSQYITISELASAVSKSPQWIYKMMRTKPSFNKYVKTIDGKKMVHKSAIWQVFGIEYEGVVKDDLPNETTIKLEDPTAAVLLEQVQTQQKQIEGMQRTIDGLSEALRAQQMISAQVAQQLQSATQKLQALQELHNATKEPQTGEPEPTAAGTDPEDAEPTPSPADGGTPTAANPERGREIDPEQATDSADQEREPNQADRTTDQERRDTDSTTEAQASRKLSFLERIRVLLTGEI